MRLLEIDMASLNLQKYPLFVGGEEGARWLHERRNGHASIDIDGF